MVLGLEEHLMEGEDGAMRIAEMVSPCGSMV